MNKGDIVLVDYPFTNYLGSKIRPAVIISNNIINQVGEDIIIAFISSNLKPPPDNDTAYVLKDSDPDFATTGLKRTSMFYLAKIVTVEKKSIKRKIGYLSQKVLENINSCLKKTFDV